MKRPLIGCALALPLVMLVAGPAAADVKTKERTQVKFEGMLGRMMGLFAGKAAKEGVVSSTAVKGNRRVTMSDATGQIVDLSEEKIYDLDAKKKTYEVTTFDELRRRMREARERAQKEAEKERGKPEKPDAQQPTKELDVDFDVKETGQKKSIAGYDTREVVMTVTVREKGKTLEDGGGLVMTADTWFGPEIAALKELGEFELRYWKQLEGPEAIGMSAEQMAMVVAQFPMVRDAMERLRKEGDKMKGTPLSTVTTFEAVKSKAQMTSEAESNSNSGGGGISGMLARKMMKKDGEVKPRATIMTLTNETLEVSTSVAQPDLDIPAGFKEKK